MPEQPSLPRLNLPPGLLAARDPLRTSLAASLRELSQSLEGHGLAGAAWPFRDAIDQLTVFLAAAAIAPLSPGEAPLPGWRRGLWKSDFADTASGLLSWAVAYLPKRSRQNRLASHLLEFLFEDGAAHLASKPRPYTSLLGLGDPSISGAGAWSDWREAFFARDDLQGLPEAAEGLTPHLETLVSLLPALDDFLAPLTFGTVARGDGARFTLGLQEESEELYPFLLVRDCEVCGRKDGLFLLAAPSAGDRYIYRETSTGHVVPVVVDQAFQRRFIAGGAPSRRSSTSLPRHQGLDRLVERSERIRPGSIADAEANVAAALTPQVLERHHRSLLMVLCEAGEAVPLELLADPSLGCRDGIAAAGRMIGLVVFWENGAAEPASTAVVREMRRLHPAEARDASRRLALWAEAHFQEEGGAGAVGGMAGRGLARWAMAAGDAELRARLVGDDAVEAELLRWLAEEEQAGRRSVAMQVSDDWLRLLSEASAAPRMARLRAFRGAVRRRAGQYTAARDELDRALALVPAGPGSFEFRARVLSDRARTHMDLRQPASAAEDGAQAAECWRRVASGNPRHPEVMLAQVELASLRGRALVALGQPRQAAALMQKVADSAGAPRTPAEVLARIDLDAALGELLRGLGDMTSSEARFRSLLDLLDRAPEGRDLRETRALALRGAAPGREPEVACQELDQAQVLLQDLLTCDGRQDLKPVLAAVLDDLAALQEQVGLLAESRQTALAAGALFGELLAEQERLDWRTAWARLLRRQALLAITLGRADEAEEGLARALDLYRQSGEGVAERFRAEELELLANRGALRISQERWEEALADLDASIQCGASAGDASLPPGILSRSHCERARIYWRQGRAEEAVQDFDRAVQLWPDKEDRTFLVEVARDRGRALLAAGYPERAEEDFTTLLERVAETEEQRRLHMARAVARMRAGRLMEALEDLAVAALESSQALRCQACQGLAHLRLGHKKQASQCFQEVLEETRDLPPGQARVENVLANGGLAILRESVGGTEQARTDWAAASRAWVPEGADPELLSWEVGEILARSGEAHLAHGDPEAALSNLHQALQLQATPAIHGQADRVRLRLRGAVAKALAELGREREAVAEARQALGVPESVTLQALELASSLHLYCCHVLVSAGACGEAARTHADLATALMQRRLDERWDAGVQGDLALALLLRGTVRVGLGQLDEALQDLARAVQLNEELRHRMDGRGLEWELALALVRRAQVHLARQDAADARSDLASLSRLLTTASAPRPGHGWVRAQLLDTLAGLLMVVDGASIAQVLGEVTGLEVWSWTERSRLEEAWCEAAGTLLTEESLPALAGVARCLGGFSTPAGDPPGGARLLEAWAQRALALAEATAPQAESALSTLVEVASSGPWDSELTCRALHGLAGLWETRGEPRRALELLDEADRALAEKEPGNTLRATSIQVCRARLWIHLGQQEKAVVALGKAAGGLESGLPEAMRAEIRRLQVVLGVAPGGQAATEPPAAQARPAGPPLESRPVEPPPEAEPAAPPAQAEPAATAEPVAAHAEAEAASPGAASPAVGLEPDLETGPESHPGAEGEPVLSTGALAWDPTLALEQVDTALELLDAGDLPEAERLLLEAGHDLPLPGASQGLDVMELLPGLLEGLQGVVEGMLTRGWLPRALAVAEYGSSLANQHLAEAFDPEAWPWWGDLELLLGRLHRQMGHLDTAAIYFRRAREIHAAVAGQGVSEEAWRDAFRAAVTGAGTWQDQGALDEADREYSEAVELGIQALAANLPEEVTLARVYMGRGRLRIQSGHPREALPDYECAMDLYLRAYEAGRADLLAELGSSRIGLAEVFYRLGRRDEGEAMRMAAIESMDDLRARGDEEEARGIGQMLIALEEFRSRP